MSLAADSFTAAPYLPNPAHIPLTGPIHFQARDITYHVMDGVHLSVRSIDALILPARERPVAILDEPGSMQVQLLSADTSISAASLTRLLNDYTLLHARLPVRDVELAFVDGEVHFKGRVHKLLDMPFTATAKLDITTSGNIQLHFTKITAAGILHKGLLDLLGLKIADLGKPSGMHVFRVQGDDVYFPIHALFPAPHFNGRLRSAKIVNDELVQVFGEPAPFAPAPVPAEHYVYFRGGVMQFSRLTMQGVDLELLNKDADQSFELSLQNLYQQTLHGYITDLPNRGMVAHIQTYRDEGSTQVPAE